MRLIHLCRKYFPLHFGSPESTPALIADGLSEGLQKDSKDGSLILPAEYYGILAPPFDSFFIEEERLLSNGRVLKRGVLFTTFDGFPENIVNSKGLAFDVSYKKGDVRWTYLVNFCHSFGNLPPHLYDVFAFICLDRGGYLLDNVEEVNFRSDSYEEGLVCAGSLPFALKAIGCIHQRNPVDHIVPKRAERRRAKKKSGVELTDYYHILSSGSSGYASSSGSKQSRGKNREHFVRAHFRYYSPEAPLFGKVSGAVYVRSHRRGTRSNGRVSKDYRVGK